MKKILIAGAALAALIGTPALAADLALKAPPPPAPPPCVWCGWYVGLNAGWIGSANDTITNTFTDAGFGGFGGGAAVGAFPFTVSDRNSGFLGGAQTGYNWQPNSNWVVGLEADIDGIGAKKTTNVVFPGNVFFLPNTQTYTREADWLSTVRGRVGVLATPQFLLFATGGLAVGEVKVGSSVSCPTYAPPCSTEASTTNTTSKTEAGWTVGAGAEWMVAPHWSVKAEYLYVDLGRENSTLTYIYGPGGALTTPSTMTSSVRNTYNIARAGVNLHF
jgi:outer membrane immunogenic protein